MGIAGDHTLVAAYSHELPKYGIEVGLTNYAACYATGLLAARRLLKKMGLDERYEGQEEPDGEMFLVEHDDGPRPFTAVLDVGLVRTTTGNRVFGALKGAVDGGLDIPHSVKRFPGYDPEGKEFDAEQCKHYIFGGHVSDYMTMMEEEDPEKYAEHFKKFADAGIDGDGLEEMYTNAHQKIREDPTYTPTKKESSYPKKNTPKSTKKEREEKIKKKVAEIDAMRGGDDDDEEDDE